MLKSMFAAFVSLAILISPAATTMAYEKEVRALSSTIGEGINKAGKKTVAVVDFTDLQGNITELGRFIAEELSVDLTISAKGFEVIDRTHLRSILAEHKLSISGLVNPDTVKKLGQIAGVQAIVTGSVTPFGDSIRLTCKVIATDTARVISAGKGDIAKTKAIEELLGRGIETAAPGAPAPAKPAPGTPAPATPSPVLGKVEAQNFIFEVQSCRLSGQSLTCSLTVTNKAEGDRDLRINSYDHSSHSGTPRSRIIDGSGYEYQTKEVLFGSKRHQFVDNTMVSGIPTRVVFQFENISPEPGRIALLEVGCKTGDKTFTAQLRNIPVTR